nr:MAG TPA: Tail tape measure [Caudoviricetes sp.]
MATIRTAIELQDNFTGVLYQVINSVNLGLSAMEDLHQTMNSPVDTASIEAARDSINQATIAVQQLDAAMQGLETPATETPTAPTNSAPVVLPVQPDVPDPLVDQPAPVDLPVEPEQPEPVQVPVHWQSDNMEVFTSTGVERFEQEVQSANNMLNTLNQTQSRIAAQAAQTDLFPDNAIADMNNMQNRLQAIQQRIQTIESNPLNMGTDTANAELEQLREQLDQAVQEQQNLNRAVDNMDVEAANQAYLRLSQTVGNTERYIRDNVDEQGRFNREIEEGTNEANSLMQTIKGAVAAYATIQTLSAALNLSDQLTTTTARMNLMNDGLQTTQDLQNMIYLSAERARGSYQATADAVSKLGLMAGDAFGSSQEIIAFMEQINKQFTIAGTEAAGVDAAMLQLTQAMASGVLRGEELNSIFEQAPTIIQSIADYLDVPIGSIREMAAEGQITADIVKAAVFAAADETNAKFESMLKTFSQVWTSFQNTALMAFQPVLQRMNEIANSEAFQTFVNNAIEGLSMVAGVALEIFDLLVGVAGLVAENWSWLSPIIYGVAAALAVYYGWQLAVNAISAISKGIHIAMAVAQMIHAAATGALTAATAAEIAAQNGLNAALYACPIVWIIVLIIALIALFYAAVAAVNKFAGTSVSATGIICGAFMVALAFIGNIFVALWNLVVDVFVLIYNLVATVANFIGNVFTDPIGAVCRLFFDLADTVLGILQALASAIDAIFGSDLAGSVQGWRDSLGGWVDDTFGKGDEVMAKMNADDMKLGRFEYGEAWNAGYSFGEGIDQSIANFDPSSLFDTNVPGADDYANLGNYGSGIGGIGSGVDDIAGNTGKIADSMDITEEDLKYLRDIAEQEAVNRFTTAEITIEQTNHNTVSGKMDLDGIVSGLTDAANEAVDKIAEGVHE